MRLRGCPTGVQPGLGEALAPYKIENVPCAARFYLTGPLATADGRRGKANPGPRADPRLAPSRQEQCLPHN